MNTLNTSTKNRKNNDKFRICHHKKKRNWNNNNNKNVYTLNDLKIKLVFILLNSFKKEKKMREQALEV